MSVGDRDISDVLRVFYAQYELACVSRDTSGHLKVKPGDRLPVTLRLLSKHVSLSEMESLRAYLRAHRFYGQRVRPDEIFANVMETMRLGLCFVDLDELVALECKYEALKERVKALEIRIQKESEERRARAL